jgi:hypothetical protein
MDDLAEHKLMAVERGGSARPVAVSPDLPLARAVSAFISAAKVGSSDVSSLVLGARVVETLERCEQALKRR